MGPERSEDTTCHLPMTAAEPPLEGVGKVLTSSLLAARMTREAGTLTPGPVVRQDLPRSTSDTTAMAQHL